MIVSIGIVDWWDNMYWNEDRYRELDEYLFPNEEEEKLWTKKIGRVFKMAYFRDDNSFIGLDEIFEEYREMQKFSETFLKKKLKI